MNEARITYRIKIDDAEYVGKTFATKDEACDWMEANHPDAGFAMMDVVAGQDGALHTQHYMPGQRP